jgi:hypothetical protein
MQNSSRSRLIALGKPFVSDFSGKDNHGNAPLGVSLPRDPL